jgi:hypothetical protein
MPPLASTLLRLKVVGDLESHAEETLKLGHVDLIGCGSVRKVFAMVMLRAVVVDDVKLIMERPCRMRLAARADLLPSAHTCERISHLSRTAGRFSRPALPRRTFGEV